MNNIKLLSRKQYSNSFIYDDHHPDIESSVFAAPGSKIIGNVKMENGSSIWFNSVLRGDNDKIHIGEKTNIQDLTMGHTDNNYPLIIGKRVTVGHNCVIHGCEIDNDCLIGMGSIVMNGVKINKGTIVGAGSIILEGMEIPPYSLVVGNPAIIKKRYDKKIIHLINKSSEIYYKKSQEFLNSFKFKEI